VTPKDWGGRESRGRAIKRESRGWRRLSRLPRRTVIMEMDHVVKVWGKGKGAAGQERKTRASADGQQRIGSSTLVPSIRAEDKACKGKKRPCFPGDFAGQRRDMYMAVGTARLPGRRRKKT